MDAQIMSAKALQRVFPTAVASCLPFRGWICQLSSIPEAQEHFLTPSARRHTHIFGGLGLKLKSMGFKTVDHDGFLEVEAQPSGQAVEAALGTMAEQTSDDVAGESLSGLESVMLEKFHCYLSPDLLLEDATSSLVDLRAMPRLARSIIGHDAVD